MALSNLDHLKVMRVGYAAIISMHFKAAMKAQQTESVNALNKALERLAAMENSSTCVGGGDDGS